MRFSALVLALVSLGIATPAPRALAQPVASSASPPQVVTSAIGEAKVTPDRARIFVGVQTRATTAAAAARDNAQRQTAVINAIAALGVGRSMISTQNYSVNPETRYDNQTQTSTITGYSVSNVVHVELERLDLVAPVVDAALAKGANQINSLEFFSSRSDEARRTALGDAIAKARLDAEAMARAAGGSLGPVLELSSAEIGPRPVYRMEMLAKSAAPTPTPIEPGEQTVQVSVSTRWQFVPGGAR
ncbi:MAG TPA: SIMPL domain-containing protein [Gemmatimonadaceae bacterium]|nr:SIMPL domain-containing protein [Gemmatimonadaceae bacterium]